MKQWRRHAHRGRADGFRRLKRRHGVAAIVTFLVGASAVAGSGTSGATVSRSPAIVAALPDVIDDPASAQAAAVRTSTLADPRLAIAAGLDPLPPQPAGVPFPTTEWPVGSLPAGVSKASLDRAIERAFGSRFNPGTVRSLVVVHGGKIVYERYKAPDSATTNYASFSVAKSFTSAMVGVAFGDGLIDPIAPAPVPQWSAATDDRGAITTDQLLRMSSGLAWDENYDDGAGSVFGLLLARNGPDYVANKPLESAPGTQFEYSTGTSALLSGIVSDAVGGPDAGVRYLTERVLQPIGITSSKVQTDPTGYFRGGLGVDSTSRDYARFGLLYLRDGIWDGVRILPPGWVDYSRSPSNTNAGYGAQWWLDNQRGFFRAAGLFGQHIVVVPRLDLVFVINTLAGGDSFTLLDTVYEAFRVGLAEI
jgi:CubicO group peptidase (beta-lactamase class C family)